MSNCDHCGQHMPTGDEDNARAGILKRTNRRRQAWVALAMMVFMTITLFFWAPLDRLIALSELIFAAYLSFASIVGFYHGASAWMATKSK